MALYQPLVQTDARIQQIWKYRSTIPTGTLYYTCFIILDLLECNPCTLVRTLYNELDDMFSYTDIEEDIFENQSKSYVEESESEEQEGIAIIIFMVIRFCL